MPKDLHHYFTYDGSLTTPPCSEIVTWIDFKEPILISRGQIQMFRLLLDDNGHVLKHNFRPIQELGDRIILFNIINNDDNTLKHDIENDISPKVDIPPKVDTNDLDEGNKNVLKDSPDNTLDESKVGDSKTKKKAKLKNGSMAHFGSLYLLSITILVFFVSN